MKATKPGRALLLDVFRPLDQPRAPQQEPARATDAAKKPPATPATKSAPISQPQASSEVSSLQGPRREKERDSKKDSIDPGNSRRIHGRITKGISIPKGEAPIGMKLDYKNELAYVQGIVSNSPVAREGTVQVGDYILSVNGQSMNVSGLTLSDVTRAIKGAKSNQNLILDIMRPAEGMSGDDINTLIKGISIRRRSGETSFGVVLQSRETSDVGGDEGKESGCRKVVYVNGILPDGAADREESLQYLDGEYDRIFLLVTLCCCFGH